MVVVVVVVTCVLSLLSNRFSCVLFSKQEPADPSKNLGDDVVVVTW